MKDSLLTVAIGSSGYGKTKGVIFPIVDDFIKNEESFIAVDSTFELISQTGNQLKEKGYKIYIFNIRDKEHSNGWNPLMLPYNYYKNRDMDKCKELLGEIAEVIFEEGSDPFWANSSKDIFVGLSLMLFKEAKEDSQVNLKNIHQLYLEAFEKFGNGLYINEYLTQLDGNIYKDIVNFMNPTANAPTETRGSILSVFSQSIREISTNTSILNIVLSDDVKISDLLNKKTATFLICQDEDKSKMRFFSSLISLIIKQLILIRTSNKAECDKFNFIFEDFLSMPKITNLDDMILTHKKRNISMIFSINNLQLLKKYYGLESSVALLSNADEVILLSKITKNEEETFISQLIDTEYNYEFKNKKCILRHFEEPIIEDIKIVPELYFDYKTLTFSNNCEYKDIQFKEITKERYLENLRKRGKDVNDPEDEMIIESFKEIIGSEE